MRLTITCYGQRNVDCVLAMLLAHNLYTGHILSPHAAIEPLVPNHLSPHVGCSGYSIMSLPAA